MELSNLTNSRAEQAQPLKLRGPNKKPTDIVIHLVGSDSEICQAALEANREKLLARVSETGDATVTKKDEMAIKIETLIACTTGWEGILMNGEEYKFSPENARKLYQTNWIREQLIAFVDNRENFFFVSAKDSSESSDASSN